MSVSRVSSVAQGLVRGVDPVREDVEARALVLGGELDAGHDLDPVARRRRRLVQPGQRVVIGDRDPGQAAFHGQVDRSVGVNVPSERFVCACRS